MYRYDIEMRLADGSYAILCSTATLVDTDTALLRVTRRRIAEPVWGDDPTVVTADGTWETYPIEETDPE